MSRKLGTTFLLTLFLLSILSFPQASADGIIYFHDPDMLHWEIQNEDRQLCAINYENGKQNMILAVDAIDLKGDKAVWLFPVPSEPDDTEVDIIKGFPELYGYDILESNDNIISGSFIAIRFTQVYTLPALFFLLTGQFAYGGALGPGEKYDITIHEHIEKMGLTTELITAEDGNAFYSYLTSRGFDLPPESKPVLDEYAGNEYTFVVSWISDVEQFKNESGTRGLFEGMKNTIGVSVSFPTDKIYFPMKPTSVYGNKKIPMLIYVTGLVTPELYPEIEQHAQVNYFQDRYNVPDELSIFFNGKGRIDDLKYTKIKLEAPSNILTGDLWISDTVPPDVIKAEFINTNMWWFAIIIFIFSSCLASLISGLIVYRKDKPSLTKFTLFGLANFITLLGLAILACTMRIGSKFTGAGKDEMKEVKISKSAKTTLIIALIFSAILIVTFFIVMFRFIAGYASIFLFIIMLMPLAQFFMIIFILVLPFVHIFYRDRKLFKFIFLFSLLFLAITLPFELALLFAI